MNQNESNQSKSSIQENKSRYLYQYIHMYVYGFSNRKWRHVHININIRHQQSTSLSISCLWLYVIGLRPASVHGPLFSNQNFNSWGRWPLFSSRHCIPQSFCILNSLQRRDIMVLIQKRWKAWVFHGFGEEIHRKFAWICCFQSAPCSMTPWINPGAPQNPPATKEWISASVGRDVESHPSSPQDLLLHLRWFREQSLDKRKQKREKLEIDVHCGEPRLSWRNVQKCAKQRNFHHNDIEWCMNRSLQIGHNLSISCFIQTFIRSFFCSIT